MTNNSGLLYNTLRMQVWPGFNLLTSVLVKGEPSHCTVPSPTQLTTPHAGPACAPGLTVLPSLSWWTGCHPFSSNIIVVQLLSCVQLVVTPWTAAHQASLSFVITWSSLKLVSTESMMPVNPFILCHLFLLLPSIFPNIRVFPNESIITSGGQNIGASASASVLPMNIQGWFPLGLTGLISLLSKGFSRAFSSTTAQKHQFFSTQPSLWSNSHIHTWLPEKPWLWPDGPLLAKWCLYFLIQAVTK